MANTGTTLLTHLGSRTAAGAVANLGGPWRSIVDPYLTGYIGLLGDRNDKGHKGSSVDAKR